MGLSKNIFPPILNSTQPPFLDKPNETTTVFVPDESGNGDEVIFEVDEPGTESTPTSSNGETAGSYTVEVEGKPEGRNRKSSLAGRE